MIAPGAPEEYLRVHVIGDNELIYQLQTLIDRGGKRLRPRLFLFACDVYGLQDEKNELAVASSLELLHTFLLIHDDIIDRDLERWGGPNITGVYYNRYAKTMEHAEALHAAESQALLAGNLCLLFAQRQIDESSFPPKILHELHQQLRKSITTTISGESKDVSQSIAVNTPDESQILNMYRNKTAEYSFALPLTFAAICSGRQNEIPKLQVLADNLGIAYQIQNDLQSTASDEREHKRTLRTLKGDDYAKQVAIAHKEHAISTVKILDITAPAKKQFVEFIQQALSKL